MEEYRRDGHIVKGIQRGAESFTLSTATAALELTQKLVGTVQVGLSPSFLALNTFLWLLIPGLIQRCLVKVQVTVTQDRSLLRGMRIFCPLSLALVYFDVSHSDGKT